MADSPESITQSVPSRIAFDTSVASARVGSRWLVIDSSIWVAVMTGLARWLARRIEILLYHGNPLNRNFHAQVAASDHDAVGSFQNLVEVVQRACSFDLGDDERFAANLLRSLPHGTDVCGALDEGLADRIDAVFESKSKTLSIVLRERLDAQVNVRKVQPLSRSQFPADSYDASHVVASDCHHFQLNEAVIEREQIPRLHRLRQAREADRDALLVTDHLHQS